LYHYTPFLFRNYQYPEGMDEHEAENTGHPPGSCKHLLWQGVRASSAAPYYLADFSLGADKWWGPEHDLPNPVDPQRLKAPGFNPREPVK
jgi:hypothetical protein